MRNAITDVEREELGRKLQELDEQIEDMEATEGWAGDRSQGYVSHKGTEMGSWEQDPDPEVSIIQELAELEEELSKEAPGQAPVSMGRTKGGPGYAQFEKELRAGASVDNQESLNRDLAAAGHNRPKPDGAPIRQYLGILNVALSDSIGLAPADWMEPDWVAVLTARDWIRYSAFPYLKDVMGDANIRLSTFQRSLKEWEEDWVSRDLKRAADDPVRIAEASIGVPRHLLVLYVAKLWDQVRRAEQKLTRTKAGLAQVFQILASGTFVDSHLDELLGVADALDDEQDKTVGRVPLSDIAASIRRLHDLIDERGVSQEGDEEAQESNDRNGIGGNV